MRKVKYFKPTYKQNSGFVIYSRPKNKHSYFILLKYGKISQQKGIYFLFLKQNAANKYWGGL